MSIATVTRAFARYGDASIKTRTREKVMEAARALNFHPNLAAQKLKSRKSRAVAIPLHDTTNEFLAAGPLTLMFSDIFRGANSVLQEFNYRVEPLIFQNVLTEAESLMSMYLGGYFDAMLIPFSGVYPPELIRDMAEQGCIVITRDSELPPHENIYVMKYAPPHAHLVAEELLRQQRQHIVLLVPTIAGPYEFLAARKRGAHKFTLHQIEAVALPDGRCDGKATVERLLAEVPEVDAIVTLDEFRGWEIFKALAARGVQVPEQVTITGSADVRHRFKPLPLMELLYAPLTLTLRAMACKLVEILIAQNDLPSGSLVPTAIPSPYPVLETLSAEQFKAAAEREMRSESTLEEVEGELKKQIEG